MRQAPRDDSVALSFGVFAFGSGLCFSACADPPLRPSGSLPLGLVVVSILQQLRPHPIPQFVDLVGEVTPISTRGHRDQAHPGLHDGVLKIFVNFHSVDSVVIDLEEALFRYCYPLHQENERIAYHIFTDVIRKLEFVDQTFSHVTLEM